MAVAALFSRTLTTTNLPPQGGQARGGSFCAQAEQGEQREREGREVAVALVKNLEIELAAGRATLAETQARTERAEAAEQRERALISKVAELVAQAEAAKPWWRRLRRRKAS